MKWRAILTTVSHEGVVCVVVRRFPTKAMAEETGNLLLDAVDKSSVKHVDVEIEQVEEGTPR